MNLSRGWMNLFNLQLIKMIRTKNGENIRCPCFNCKNTRFLHPDDVVLHLYRRGFKQYYWNWTCHGEPLFPVNDEHNEFRGQTPEEVSHLGDYEQMPWEQRMVHDCLRSRVPPCDQSHHNDKDDPSVQPPLDEPVSGLQGDGTSQLSDRFFDMLKVADQPLFEGCENHSRLSFVARMLSIKSDANMSEADFNAMITAIKEVLPPDNTVPTDYYQHRKTMNDLGLPVVKIDACKNGCMLYWKNDATQDSCKFCDEPRYKQINSRRRVHVTHHRKRVAQAILRYLPLTPRLQRLYASNATAKHMTWHATHERIAGVMEHPSDAEAWKHLDRTYPVFANEPRNIRLGLCADGFAPHGQFGRAYSCWPVIVTPYNLPPGMCMKRPYMFLSLICPGPKNPKKNIDVFLQPLIEELNNLWVFGEMTYDISKNEYFRMKAALLWTINDFPAYGMLSGWSTAGVLGCPICMENANAFHLQHGRKASYFDCHRAFLLQNHSYRKNKQNRAESGSSSTVVYRGGSVSTAVHRLRLAEELGREPTPKECFVRTHRKKDGTLEAGRATQIVEQFDQAFIDKCSQGVDESSINQNELWDQIAIGSRNSLGKR